jgi:hypothetical protein
MREEENEECMRSHVTSLEAETVSAFIVLVA